MFSSASFGGDGAPQKSVLDAGNVQFVNRGSLAFGLAYAHMILSASDEILLPAYHCRAMVEPVVTSGGTPVFYKILPNLSPDLSDVASRITSKTRAIFVPHYFGFHQNVAALREFCGNAGILLIEDCAHSFFGEIDGLPIGSYGDYAIGSAWKFFPINEGACLVSSRRPLSDLPMENQGFFADIKAFLNTIEYAGAYERVWRFSGVTRTVIRIQGAIWGVFKKFLKRADSGLVNHALPPPGGTTGFDPARIFKNRTRWAAYVMRMTNVSRIAQKRREHYALILKELSSACGITPLFKTLPAGVVPQVVPFLVDNPKELAYWLKEFGVPVIRFGEFLWEGMDPGFCRVSEEYSRRVFQLPCHQDLTSHEIDWMILRVSEALNITNALRVQEKAA